EKVDGSAGTVRKEPAQSDADGKVDQELLAARVRLVRPFLALVKHHDPKGFLDRSRLGLHLGFKPNLKTPMGKPPEQLVGVRLDLGHGRLDDERWDAGVLVAGPLEHR